MNKRLNEQSRQLLSQPAFGAGKAARQRARQRKRRRQANSFVPRLIEEGGRRIENYTPIWLTTKLVEEGEKVNMDTPGNVIMAMCPKTKKICIAHGNTIIDAMRGFRTEFSVETSPKKSCELEGFCLDFSCPFNKATPQSYCDHLNRYCLHTTTPDMLPAWFHERECPLNQEKNLAMLLDLCESQKNVSDHRTGNLHHNVEHILKLFLDYLPNNEMEERDGE